MEILIENGLLHTYTMYDKNDHKKYCVTCDVTYALLSQNPDIEGVNFWTDYDLAEFRNLERIFVFLFYYSRHNIQ